MREFYIETLFDLLLEVINKTFRHDGFDAVHEFIRGLAVLADRTIFFDKPHRYAVLLGQLLNEYIILEVAVQTVGFLDKDMFDVLCFDVFEHRRKFLAARILGCLRLFKLPYDIKAVATCEVVETDALRFWGEALLGLLFARDAHVHDGLIEHIYSLE